MSDLRVQRDLDLERVVENHLRGETTILESFKNHPATSKIWPRFFYFFFGD